jgi:hypothetical protein
MTASRRSPTVRGRRHIFFKSLRMRVRAACLLRLDWTSPSRTSPSASTAPPKINHPPIDFQIDLVKMPGRMRFRTALAQMRGDHRTEVIPPAARGLVRDRDPPLGEQVLGVTKAECEPEIEPNRLIYDVADFPHPLGYCAYMHPTSWRDKARRTDPSEPPQTPVAA